MRKEENNLFPVFMKMEGLRVLLIGGGKVGAEKLRAILANSPLALVTVVSETFSEEIAVFQADGLRFIQKHYEESDMENQDIVFAAVNNIETATRIRDDAHKRRLLVNVADKPELCDFYLGSVVKKGNLKIGISTNGKSPTLAKRVKETLDEAFPEEIDEALDKLYTIRSNLKGDFSEKVKRLNEITSSFAKSKAKEKPVNFLRVRKAFIYSLVVITLMITGHLLLNLIPTGGFTTMLREMKKGLGGDFLLFLLAGFIAQMIDGALGMAYGVSVTTFLMSLGMPAITPAVASASMHASEVFTTGTASLVYMRFRNINKKLFKKLLWPGIVGAVLGALSISLIGKDALKFVKPIVSVYTLLLGVSIILKALNIVVLRRGKIKVIAPIAAAGGFLDSVGGGGWGPIVTSSLIAGGRNIRYAVGSSHLAKFFVALVSSITFFAVIGLGHWKIVFGLVVGGMLAAPLSIYLSNKIPVRKGLILVGIVVIIVSLNTLIRYILK